MADLDKPAPEPKRSWADEAENVPPSSSETTETVATPPIAEAVDRLSIGGEDKTEETKGLDLSDDSEIKAVTTGNTIYASASTFEELNLSQELLKGLYSEMNFSKPSRIQAVSLPMILTPPYRNLIAQAHNGTGKTTCFTLGMLGRVDMKQKVPQAICVCPTRELAIQNEEVLLRLGKYTGVTSLCAVAGLPRTPITAQVVIGTPGTLKRCITSGQLSTRYMKILVFDEADHMLAEDGFQDDSLRIMKYIERSTANCQVLLFSATFNENVKDFASKVVKDGNQLFVKKEELSLESIKQYKVYCPDELAKIELLRDRIFLVAEKLAQTIIFVRTRKSASDLHKTLSDAGWSCTAISGNLEQEKRDTLIKEFRAGLTKVLICTDILARGFDQSQVNLVVNFDLPVKHYGGPDYEVYLHRVGRAGRFGRKGAVFNLICTERDKKVMDDIEKYFQHHVAEIPSWQSEEGFEAALKEAGLI
ncbi:DEAD-box ATP-dependent RNA helicase 38 [Nymphaea colorata]|nr:DEAD-box ATP-dependent RNA helicase 38 [Nymphaea colorata]